MTTTTTRRITSWVVATVGLAVAATSAAAQTTYRVVDVGRLTSTGSHFSSAFGLNESNQVVGFTFVVTGYRAFLFDPDTGLMLNLGDLAGGDDFSVARAINDAGEVVGWSSAAIQVDGMWDDFTRATRWTSGDGLIDLGAEINPDGHSFAFDVNGSGVVTGRHPPSGIATFTGRGFTWQPGSAVTYLPFLSSHTHTEPRAVNDAGVVVGESKSGTTTRSFWWESSGGIVAVPGDTTDASRANDVNAAGTVVGVARIDDGMGGVDTAGLVVRAGQQHLIPTPPGAVWTEALAVNDAGQVVGTTWYTHHSQCLAMPFPPSPSCYSDLASDRAFLWTEAGGMVDLTTQVDPDDPLAGAVVITSAHDVNERGYIAANGFIVGPVGLSGQHAFLLVPTQIFADGFESGDSGAWSATQP